MVEGVEALLVERVLGSEAILGESKLATHWIE